ncbi:putative quinol monooxygenase [Chryseolinea soli]|uniref:Antibiotic biosynthesis monooxygenase n=1 Tax=Chryseolinea soli TaxID=2321403 RepID=A0A385SSM8_9BACT|nr:putative quinol monooxygenase [Chryseolinea soli]AYB33546.1 antibiotic biosynthesis monooxygenase [Chryseolinea soli]
MISRLLTTLLFAVMFYSNVSAQDENKQMVRLARLIIDAKQLKQYIAILKEEAEESVRIEPGVLTLFAVQEKDNPTHFTILEIYADSAAYRSHLQTPHFIRYKTSTKDMVKSLELVETTPLIPNMKIKVDSAAIKKKKH